MWKFFSSFEIVLLVRLSLKRNAFLCEFIGVCSQPHTTPACLLDFGFANHFFYWFLASCWGHMFCTFLVWFVRFCWHPGKCCKNLLFISKLVCFVANPLALSSSFLTTSLIYGETSVSNTLWDHAVLFLRVTFGMCSHKVKSFLNISYFMGVTEEVMLLLLLLVTVTVCWVCTVYQAIRIDSSPQNCKGNAVVSILKMKKLRLNRFPWVLWSGEAKFKLLFFLSLKFMLPTHPHKKIWETNTHLDCISKENFLL